MTNRQNSLQIDHFSSKEVFLLEGTSIFAVHFCCPTCGLQEYRYCWGVTHFWKKLNKIRKICGGAKEKRQRRKITRSLDIVYLYLVFGCGNPNISNSASRRYSQCSKYHSRKKGGERDFFLSLNEHLNFLKTSSLAPYKSQIQFFYPNE